MSQVRTGLERWLADGASTRLRPGCRLGLLVHPSSVDRRGQHLIERLVGSATYRVERIFAPEHGLYGHEQDMEPVRDHHDPISRAPVISLYGTSAESLRVAPERLADLDAVVVDLQDVGSRYYTYAYSLSFLMESAAAVGLPVIVLDRPNPIGGTQVEGPVLDPAFRSFVGRYPIPVRHGMTLAELAGLFNDRFGIGCDLRVVPMEGWRRGMDFEDTGLPWVAPSPNMPSVTTARVYPGGCLVEGTNLSEGRGTTLPFELVGAPWLDAVNLVRRLREEQMPGVAFRLASFRPATRKFAEQACRGVQVLPLDSATFRPFATFLVLLRECLALAPREFAWRTEAYEFESERLAIDLLLGHAALRPQLEAGAPLAELEVLWEDELRTFLGIRAEYLLYE